MVNNSIKEHTLFPHQDDVTIDNLTQSYLLKYDHDTYDKAGFYSYYRIGAEWVNNNYPLVVTTKSKMENIDFLTLFSTCFSNNIDSKRLASIYKIYPDARPIDTSVFQSVLSPIILLHFIALVNEICRKGIKKGYIATEDNLNAVKGVVQIPTNERLNIINKRYNKIYCSYSEYTTNCPENRILKRALGVANRIIKSKYNAIYNSAVRRSICEIENLMYGVDDNITIQEVRKTKSNNKLYANYRKAIKLADIILRQYDMQIYSKPEFTHSTLPFYIDMSLLYELYVYGLLKEQYGDDVKYQYSAASGYPDFLIKTGTESWILDAKYKPKLINKNISTQDLRQLSGYGRDESIRNFLNIGKGQVIDCLFIYPQESESIGVLNPFKGCSAVKSLIGIEGCSDFYKMKKICIPIPVLKSQEKID